MVVTPVSESICVIVFDNNEDTHTHTKCCLWVAPIPVCLFVHSSVTLSESGFQPTAQAPVHLQGEVWFLQDSSEEMVGLVSQIK